jgi:tRNA pseudouridine55 synthase
MTESNPKISGLIPIHKPRGITSKDVSRILMRQFGKIKLGHVGTLDPDADGVLPVLVGNGTKFQDYLVDLPKAYSFTLRFGAETETLDATGNIRATMPYGHITKELILRSIPKFTGPIEQVPPIYSAVKYKGKELYKYAHSGKTDDQLPLESLKRKVTIYSLSIDHLALPDVDMTVHCSKGTYVRTLAHDLAKTLDSLGHVTRLTRILSAGFQLSDCIKMEQACAAGTDLKKIVVPMEKLSIGLPTWTPDDMVLLQRLVNGQHVILNACELPTAEMGYCDLLAKSQCGTCVGIISVEFLENGFVKLHMKRGL